ncbi:hypothetical protein F53441_6267 [Fusarium austroafricanum]|uniref:O-methyltransferase domain-containing protein n=1 Tax=Fusarium austroafricanum TaxID=2364996 RepID=A0A8H4KI59_9HYPO|nr:hypothetical protein F53441_6267 [Fusarium austroafricanum]
MTSSDIIKRMQDAAKACNKKELGDRETLLDLNRQLLAELETPTDFIQRIWFAIVFQFSKPIGRDSTPLSNTLALENYQHSILLYQRAAAKSFCHFPDYFKQANYLHPGLTDGPYQYAHNSSLPFFDWLLANPPHVNWFGSFMSVYRAGNTNWWTFCPVEERLSNGFDKSFSDAFLVYVGGGRGHDLLSFSQGIKPPGRLVLQDLPEAIADVTEKLDFETQSHDFFTPQPVQHARAYFIHSILHDWGAEESFGAMVAEASLEVVDIYSNAASPESVIELRLPRSPLSEG